MHNSSSYHQSIYCPFQGVGGMCRIIASILEVIKQTLEGNWVPSGTRGRMSRVPVQQSLCDLLYSVLQVGLEL